QQNAAWTQVPGAFSGSWGDLNEIGGNAGASAPDVTALMHLTLRPLGAEGSVIYAKYFPAVALFILGLGAWTFFRQLKLSPLAAVLGGLAAALNSAFFSTACWGVASQQIAIGFSYFALAVIVSNTPETPRLTRWVRWALAGLCVGANVMQGADIGAIFSLFIAAFVLCKTLTDESGSIPMKVGRSVGRVAVVAVFAGFIAWQSIVSLLGVAVTGVAGTAQDAETKARQWNFCTQWSEPKIETLGLFVPGLFGYKMDTPINMEVFQDAYRGGVYWGAVGRDPQLDSFFANGAKGTPPPHGYMRQTGGGGYAGILVALLAAWAIAQSLRRQNSVFGETQRWMIRFWFALLVISLLLSFGRFGFFGGYPFRLLYELPGASLIRNPTKFLLVFSWALVIVFAYGVHGLSRRYLETPAANFKSSIAQLQSWWRNVRGFDRKWTLACLITFAASMVAWLAYATQKAALVHYLQLVSAPWDPNEVAAFSISQAGWFLLFFALAIGIVALVIAGIFSGKRARLGGLLLGAVLLVDMGRANLPWLTYWDYVQKYDIDPANLNHSTNPIINLLGDKPYEHRVAILPFAAAQRLPQYDDYFAGNQGVYSIEWAQHHFPYYNIQSSDVVQRPRMATDLGEYYQALEPRGTRDSMYLVTRRWQLCNIRYFLGTIALTGNVDTLSVLNSEFDPSLQRFRIVQRFDLVSKPGIEQIRYLSESELTAETNANGGCALYEFTGALPRAKLYANWQVPMNDKAAVTGLTVTNLGTDGWTFLQQVGTNDFLTLNKLASPSFDPWQTVLLADSPVAPNPSTVDTSTNAGSVEFTGYSPKDIKLHTQAATTTVLLLNDRYDQHWSVTVDGKPAPLLRANFIMRGVCLPPGEHNVEFYFSLPMKPLYVTLSAIIFGILLCGFLFYLEHKPQPPATNTK
ncbi:MAG: hypothetical protein ABSE90_12250, partial [Verrucomicrobiota bacterium]